MWNSTFNLAAYLLLFAITSIGWCQVDSIALANLHRTLPVTTPCFTVSQTSILMNSQIQYRPMGTSYLDCEPSELKRSTVYPVGF